MQMNVRADAIARAQALAQWQPTSAPALYPHPEHDPDTSIHAPLYKYPRSRVSRVNPRKRKPQAQRYHTPSFASVPLSKKEHGRYG